MSHLGRSVYVLGNWFHRCHQKRQKAADSKSVNEDVLLLFVYVLQWQIWCNCDWIGMRRCMHCSRACQVGSIWCVNLPSIFLLLKSRYDVTVCVVEQADDVVSLSFKFLFCFFFSPLIDKFWSVPVQWRRNKSEQRDSSCGVWIERGSLKNI